MKGALDREVMTQHKMTIMVRDQGFPSNRNFTRVMVNVQDENDHPPQFVSDVTEASVFETSAIGTSVVQLMAIDQDKGSNAEISYSVVSGKKKTYIIQHTESFNQLRQHSLVSISHDVLCSTLTEANLCQSGQLTHSQLYK